MLQEHFRSLSFALCLNENCYNYRLSKDLEK